MSEVATELALDVDDRVRVPISTAQHYGLGISLSNAACYYRGSEAEGVVKAIDGDRIAVALEGIGKHPIFWTFDRRLDGLQRLA